MSIELIRMNRCWRSRGRTKDRASPNRRERRKEYFDIMKDVSKPTIRGRCAVEKVKSLVDPPRQSLYSTGLFLTPRREEEV